MSRSVVITDWSAGANNIAPADRLPERSVRKAVNVDPTPGGTMVLRAGYEQVYAGLNVRGVLALRDKLLVADGESLVEYDVTRNSHRVIRQIAGAGVFAGDTHAGVLYFCTENECLQYDGQDVTTWGVPDVLVQPNVYSSSGGSLQPGYYNVAVTHTDAMGREGGTDRPVVVYVEESGAINIDMPTPADGCVLNLYVGSVNGGSLYLQGVYESAQTVTIGLVRDDTQRAGTILMRAPQPGSIVTSHNGVVFIANGKLLVGTAPMRPHMVDRTRLFFQFPANVNAVMSAGGLFVSADKSYVLTNVESTTPSQDTVLEFPAIQGTSVILPDGRGAWMTQYGQAITNGQTLELVNRPTFTVGERERGAAGVVENNGNQMIVTSTKGGNGPGGLAAADYFFGEVLNP